MHNHHLVYQEPVPISEEEWTNAVASGDSGRIARALVSVAFFETNWQNSQEKCLLFLEYSDPAIAGVAATCIGHIARIHGQLDLDKVLPVLSRIQKDNPSLGQIDDALDDIAIFIQAG